MSLTLERRTPAFSLGRVLALVRRYLYLLRGSWPRIVELAYWPTVQMLMWGFLTQFLATNSSFIAQTFTMASAKMRRLIFERPAVRS